MEKYFGGFSQLLYLKVPYTLRHNRVLRYLYLNTPLGFVVELPRLHGDPLFLLIRDYKLKLEDAFGQSLVELYNVVEVLLEDMGVLRHIQNSRDGIDCRYYLVCPLHEYESLQTPQIPPQLFPMKYCILKFN